MKFNRLFFRLCLCASLVSVFPVQVSAQNSAHIQYFGYAAVACDLDDPFDDTDKTDYSDEVSTFTNFNHVCVTGDMDVFEKRLKTTSELYDLALYVDPVFFQVGFWRKGLRKNAKDIWAIVSDRIRQSQVDTQKIVFYLSDEPTLRKIPMQDVEEAAKMIKAEYPSSKIMVIEAFKRPEVPIIPDAIDIWGFNAYTINDPGKDKAYMEYLDLAITKLKPHQSLALIMDAQHTPIHTMMGLTEDDMAGVAYNYLTLAQSRKEISTVLGYTWAGGIDHDKEKGVRDLPSLVIDAHKDIGKQILGKR